MKVVQLFRKDGGEQGWLPCDRLILKQGYGIAGDAHAVVGSPRQVLLVSQSTLEQFGLQPGQLRENLVLDGLVEDLQSGQVLQTDDGGLIRIIGLCEPCSFLDTLQSGLAKPINGQRGRLGMVVRDGTIGVGDRLTVSSYRFSSIPDAIRGKFEEFVVRIPLGKVVSTPDLLLALGLTRSYYRSIPTWLKKSAPPIPVHRIVSRDGCLMTTHLLHQRGALLAEGVEMVGDRVAAKHFWEPIYFHELLPISKI